jgi:hypothetical protein
METEMVFTILKTGFSSFDALHALGLAILLSETCQTKVNIANNDISFVLTLALLSIPRISTECMDRILDLPKPEEILELSKNPDDICFLNLDGLLAVSLSLPGPRVVSVSDLIYKPFLNQKQRSDRVNSSLTKVLSIVDRVKDYLNTQIRTNQNNFLDDILADYSPNQPKAPVIEKYVDRKRSLPIWSVLEPALGFSNRSPASNCMLESYNLTIKGTRFAILLAVIAAARMLRAQRFEGQNILFWVPKVTQGVILPSSALPTLHFFKGNLETTVLFHALDMARTITPISHEGFYYRVYSERGPQQPLPTEEGEISLENIRKLSSRQINYWKQKCESSFPLELHLLARALFDRSFEECIKFFISWHDQIIKYGSTLNYSLDNLLEVIDMLDPDSKQPLSKVLDEKSGARKFGALLRQLHETNRGEYLESYEMLKIAKSPEDILSVLSRTMSEIVTMNPKKSVFRVFPTNNDVKILLEQIECYGTSPIAQILIILASIHVSRKN